MAIIERDTDESTDSGHESQTDRFLASIEEKYAKSDRAEMDAEDGVTTDEGNEEGTTDDDDADDSDEEHTDAGTSTDDSDGNADESDDDSPEDDDDEHTDDDASDDSDDDDDAEDTDDDTDEEEDVSDETKARLGKGGADLTLEDVPKEFRGIITKKLQGIESAFSRQSQEATAFRAERTKFQAEEKFRTENPDMYIAELLLKDETLIEKVQARIDKAADPEAAEAFAIIVKDKRKVAADDLVATATAEEQLDQRITAMVTLTQTRARALGVSSNRCEKAVALAISQKKDGELTDAEIETIVAAEAKEFKEEQRGTVRQTKKDIVKNRTANRKAAPPATKRPATAATVRPAGKKEKVNHDDEGSRQGAYMKTIKRIMPGTK